MVHGLVVLLIAVMGSSEVFASERELGLRAGCVYHILKYVEWDDGGDGTLRIGVVGDQGMVKALRVYENRRVWGQSLVVEAVDLNAAKARVYDVVYIQGLVSGDECFLDQKGLLTIGDDPEFIIKGGVLKLHKVNLRIKIKSNHTKAKALGLRLSSKLLSLSD
jgi:hypothetical protein